MFILRLVGKVMLIPVWILVVMAWIFVKVVISIYSFVKGFVVLGLGALMIGTVICYHDWNQVLFLMCLYGTTFAVLFAGVFIEVSLESIRMLVGKIIMA